MTVTINKNQVAIPAVFCRSTSLLVRPATEVTIRFIAPDNR
jgi:hypothetical protein